MEISIEMLKAITQAQEGKEEGFNKIYSSTYNYVYFRSKSIMKNDNEAWDLLQEVYIVAYRSISKLEKPENLYAWLGGIVYNLGMKSYRKKKDVLLGEENEGIFDEIRSTDKDIQPEEYIEDKQTSDIIKELIDQLPELQKVAVIAYYYDEMSVGKIAEIFKCSTGTIKSRLNYARQYLKQAVEAKEKKDNVKLHTITIPTILMALRMLSEDSTVSAHAAQIAYNGVCSNLGMGATAINVSTAGTNALGSISSVAQTAGTATKATGIIAKIMAATTGVKILTVSIATVVCVSSILGGLALKNSLKSDPIESNSIIASPTPIEEQNIVETVIPTVQPESDSPVELNEEENKIFNLIIHGLTDSIASGYRKGDIITDEQKMGIAYQVLYSLCVPEGNKLEYEETNKEYSDPNFEGDALISKAYVIPKEDIDLLLNTIIGKTKSEDKDYEGFIYDSGHYYLIEACTYVGFKDFWIDDKSVSYNYRKSRKFEIVSTETTEKKAFQEGIREIGHAGTDGAETIRESSYSIEFETVEPTKFGGYSLVSFQNEEQDYSYPISLETNDYSIAYELMRNCLQDHIEEASEAQEYGYSEYFIYDWGKTPILIIRDIFQDKSCIYTDYHYIVDNNILESYSESIHGFWDSAFYMKDANFIIVSETEEFAAETYSAYLYGDLEGKSTKVEELWWWFRNNESQTTQFLDLDSYKVKRAEVESLELIKWYSIVDLSFFE